MQLLSSPLGSIDRLTIQHESGAQLDVLAGRGGCLVGWRVMRNGALAELLDGYASDADLQERYYSSHCGARLSPFPNRVKDGAWSFAGKSYQLDKNFPWENGHAIHGLLFDRAWTQTGFEVLEQTAWLTLECTYDGSHPGFPFAYKATTRYGLSAESFEVETMVHNLGTQPLPFGEGWHPYFRAGCAIDEAMLQMTPATLKIEVDDRSIPTGVLTPDDDFAKLALIGTQNLNTCWKFAGPGERAEVVLRNPATELTFKYWQDRGPGQYNYIQLYTPPARQSLAIEPMTCPPDVLNNGMGLIVLEPGQSHRLRFGCCVSNASPPFFSTL